MEALKSIRLGSLSLEQFLVALITLLVCLAVIRILMSTVNKAVEKLPIERTLHGFIRSLAKILLYFLTVIIVAGTLGVPATSLVAVLGVAGLGVSLAAQSSLANVAGGLMILINKPFTVDDYIEAAGVSGTVTGIGLAYTRIRTPDNKVIFAPNSEISGEKITNFTAEELRRMDISVLAPYSSGVDEVKEVLSAAVMAVPGILAEPDPFINVLAFEETAVHYTLRVWVHREQFLSIQFALLDEIKRLAEQRGVTLGGSFADEIHRLAARG